MFILYSQVLQKPNSKHLVFLNMQAHVLANQKSVIASPPLYLRVHRYTAAVCYLLNAYNNQHIRTDLFE